MTCTSGSAARAGRTRSPGAGWERGVPRGLARAARRVLARRVRLARAGGAAQRVRAVHDHDRRPADPLPARPIAGAGRAAADRHPRLPGLGGRVHPHHRAAERSARATAAIRPTRSTWSCRRCRGSGSPSPLREPGWQLARTARAWVGADAPPRLRALRRAGRRHRRRRDRDARRRRPGRGDRHPRQHRPAGDRADRRSPRDRPRRLRRDRSLGPRPGTRRAARALRGRGQGLPAAPEHPAAGHRVRPDRLARRSAGVDRGEVPGVDDRGGRDASIATSC